jgi:hypothetical protein
MVYKARVRVNGSLVAMLCSIVALAAAAPASAAGLIYVNRCAAGCTVTPGVDNAIAGTSIIPNSTSNLSAFAQGDSVFSDTVTCLRSLFARYDVEVITANPGAVARREMMLAGNAAQLGQPVGSLGVAPTGSASDNRIAFAFANDIGADPDKLCWVAAQQLGFLYALDYEFYCPDIMSASIGCGLKSFTDLAEPCGYDMATPTCPTGGQSTQNTAALLGVRAGLSDRIFLNEFELPRPAP